MECAELKTLILSDELAANIARKLTAIALGEGYHENALRLALDLSTLTEGERQVIRRYLAGTHYGFDHGELQEMRIKG
jgi:hypothetical protein